MRSWVQDQIVLITGGAKGLGRALVQRFVDEGARVATLDRDDDALAQLRRDLGPEVLTLSGDVRSYASHQAAVSEVLGRFGRLDTFIGNAGLFDFSTRLEDIPAAAIEAAVDELMAVNTKGYILGAHATVAALRQSQGSMIFTLSSAINRPGHAGVLYSASKAAGLGLVRQLAHELAPSVRVNAVAPGGMCTDLGGLQALGQGDRRVSDLLPPPDIARTAVPLGRFFEPKDVAGSYLLLASRSEGAALTGVVLSPDGGAQVA